MPVQATDFESKRHRFAALFGSLEAAG